MRSFSVVVAATEDGGIGLHGNLPWHLPTDLRRFRHITSQPPTGASRNAVIMGRLTYASLPDAVRPLPGRLNVVLSRRAPGSSISIDCADTHDQVLTASSLPDALDLVARVPDIGHIFVIGGGQVYAAALELPECREILMTRVMTRFECDTFFPPIPPDFVLESEERGHDVGVDLRFLRYLRTPRE